ncbi:MAG: von Willebrand factor type A domain-containing protein [Herbinix sp.]|nr:von Willebrand factor type A domain-containing protein [Herbinix sp.]
MRKTFTRLLSVCMVVVMIVGLAGCAKSEKSTQDIFASGQTKSDSSSYKTEYTMDTSKATVNSNVEYETMAGEYDQEFITDRSFTEEFNTEEYSGITENNIKAVKNYPMSTFSVDVDTASYSNVRRMINNNGEVVPDAVRIEEMINYFKYDYESPMGDVPFSVNTEISDCPWNKDAKLLLIGLQAKDIDLADRPSSNLVFLLDVSGSMYSDDKLPLMQKAFIMLTENLNENDRISIVTYAGMDRVILEGVRGDETMKIVSAIEELSAGGSTAGAAGIEKAYSIAEEYFIEDGNNRIILATDGDLNVGITSEGELKRLVEKERKKGVFLSVLGFGTGNIKDNKMETLADNGNGNYSYIDSILEAKKVLVDEMGGTLFTIAKDVKLQIEFNPAYIKGYRLIGYENRLLNTEDFNDDTKDAGEIGAGHRVTALYEIIETSSEQEIAEADLKYQSDKEEVDSNEWLTVNIRYKEPKKDKSQLISVPVDEKNYSSTMPENLAFASSVAAFGMLLRDSKWKGDASYDMILDILEDQDLSHDEYKDEFISLVKKMKRVG